MAFRRKGSFRRFSRFRRRNPYDVQRFSLCSAQFAVSSGNCESTTTDMVALLPGGPFDPDQTLAIATGKQSLLGFQTPPVAKSIIFGGARFWHEFQVDVSQQALIESGLTGKKGWGLKMLWFIAKIPHDPQTLLPVYVPDLWDPTTGGTIKAAANTGDIQYDLLWTRYECMTLALDFDNPDNFLVSSNGGVATITAGFTAIQPATGIPSRLWRVKTKRRLSEMEGLYFGVCSHSSGLATSSGRFDYTVSCDLYGQAAVKAQMR